MVSPDLHCRWSSFHQFVPYPTWIPTAIKYSHNQDFFLKDLIVNSERKPLGKKAMVPEDLSMNALEILERVNIREEGIEKIRAKTG
jgi:hypothetical protein